MRTQCHAGTEDREDRACGEFPLEVGSRVCRGRDANSSGLSKGKASPGKGGGRVARAAGEQEGGISGEGGRLECEVSRESLGWNMQALKVTKGQKTILGEGGGKTRMWTQSHKHYQVQGREAAPQPGAEEGQVGWSD